MVASGTVARAEPSMVSASPGFQLVTSFANAGSGLNQFSPLGTGRGSDRSRRTNTRPVNGLSSAVLSKVRANSAAGSAGARAATNTRDIAKRTGDLVGGGTGWVEKSEPAQDEWPQKSTKGTKGSQEPGRS